MTAFTQADGPVPVLDSRRDYRERVKYVVGSEREQVLITRALRSTDDGLRVPEGIRHAVDSTTKRVSCGVSTSSLFVFDDLDWTTMLSNEMCPRCKRSAF